MTGVPAEAASAAKLLARGFVALAAPTIAIALLAATGCTSLAERIAVPQASRALSEEQEELLRHGGLTRHESPVAPDVTLSWWLVPPADRGIEFDFERTAGGGDFSMQVAHPGSDAQALPAHGTVLYLHGWNMDATTMLLWGLVLADHGYRGIAVDLRGHGASSDAPVGYGSREAEDVARLLDRLDADVLTPPVYLFGVSYGAATALLSEEAVRDRIAGIVAMAPYANAADGIRGAVGEILDNRGSSLRSRLLYATMRLRYGDEGDIDRAIVEAAARLGLDLAAIDVVAAVADSTTCTLLLHGAKDGLVPVDASRRLAAASPLVRYLELEDETHLSLPMRIDVLGDPVAGWLDAVAAGGCPALAIPPARSPLAQPEPAAASSAPG